jgi:hypothetical protein
VITQPKTTDHSLLLDLGKISLTSLALLGVFTGCSSQTTPRRAIDNRETVTVNDILANPQRWINREVNIKARPELKEDLSRFYFDGGDRSHLYLNLDLRYGLNEKTQISSEARLVMIDDRSIELCDKSFLVKDPAQEYVLESDTYIVSGTIKKYSNSDDVYLKYMNSMYGEQR